MIKKIIIKNIITFLIIGIFLTTYTMIGGSYAITSLNYINNFAGLFFELFKKMLNVFLRYQDSLIKVTTALISMNLIYMIYIKAGEVILKK